MKKVFTKSYNGFKLRTVLLPPFVLTGNAKLHDAFVFRYSTEGREYDD